MKPEHSHINDLYYAYRLVEREWNRATVKDKSLHKRYERAKASWLDFLAANRG